MKRLLITLIMITSLLYTLSGLAADKSNHLFQVATIGSLVKGVYDGDYRYGDLFAKGNQGLGTFTAIDGEMVALNGIYYRIKANGQLRQVKPDEMTPFAEVVNFKAVTTKNIKPVKNYQQLMQQLENGFSNKNIPHAIRIDGDFEALHLRSLRKQTKPYRPLVVASKEQAIFNLKNTKGTLVGFWFPKYWSGIAVPGLHLHFISADHKMGGHVLELSITKAKQSSAPIHQFTIHLPGTKSFAAANLDPMALHCDMKEAEGGGSSA